MPASYGTLPATGGSQSAQSAGYGSQSAAHAGTGSQSAAHAGAYGAAHAGSQSAYGVANAAYGSQSAYGASPGGHASAAAPQPVFTDPPPYHDASARSSTPQPLAPSGEQPPLRDQANATAGVSERLRFIRLTYLHLLGAILAFAGLEYLLMTNSFLVEKVSVPFVRFALGGRWNWGVVLAVFMAVSWVADYWASHAKSRPMQYAGLGFYVIAEAVIFVPLLAIVAWKTQAILARGGQDPNIIRDSAYVTLAIFGALTASVFITKKDFSFLRSGLVMASGAALMLIVLSLVFGFNLGLVFSIGMVLLAAGYILFQTSQVLAHYDPRNHVAAALALFSSVALMFWYVIRIFMRARE
ncbi:MAG: Bax inhibitor-1 family protein [Myxococcales bacterium]|nr:Bax inhibitor-1 family protein [Myxococcales bacterium]